MNHWAADWAAWWETSILSSATECPQPSPSSPRCSCPGPARTYSAPPPEKDGVWSAVAASCSRDEREERASGGEMELSQIPAGLPVNTNRRANPSNMMQNVVKRSNKSIKTPTVAAFGWVSSLDWIQTLTRKIFIFDPPKIPPHAPLVANSIHSNLLAKHGWVYIWRTTYTQ